MKKAKARCFFCGGQICDRYGNIVPHVVRLIGDVYVTAHRFCAEARDRDVGQKDGSGADDVGDDPSSGRTGAQRSGEDGDSEAGGTDPYHKWQRAQVEGRTKAQP